MNTRSCKADLHVHSCHSHRPSSWILQRIGCSESYTRPSVLYRKLRERGMDLVTITDHNTIDGCLEIGHLEHTFMSEEVTTYFPEDGCKLHVLVYHLSEKQHDDLTRVRKNVYELIDYLNAEGLLHAVAHPMYSINGKLTKDHVRKMMLLFENFELNGAKDALQNTAVRRLVGALTRTRINALADRYDIQPVGPRPWGKRLISGSDDHACLYPGLSYTEVACASNAEDYLRGVVRDRVTVHTRHAEPETLAHTIYSIMYQYYDRTFHVSRWIRDADLSAFLEDMLCPSARRPTRVLGIAASFRKKSSLAVPAWSLEHAFLKHARKALLSDPELTAHMGDPRLDPERLDVSWMRFVNRFSATLMRQLGQDMLSRLTQADLFSLFSASSSTAFLSMMLSPYVVAYSLFARDRAFSLSCLKADGGETDDLQGPARSIAAFTDTFHEVNGVAAAIRSQVASARSTGKAFTVMHCDSNPRQTPHVAAFEPVGVFDLPEYPELKVYCPPILSIMDTCYREGFTHIHAETPGPMGMAALAVSRYLKLPFRGTYHTSLPQTVGALTGDTQLENLFWKYVVWFYGQMERIYVPSAMTARELMAKGLAEEKIRVHPWGVDTRLFHPGRRNGFFRNRYSIQDGTLKLLYVGRVSEEKNLGVLAPMMRRIQQRRPNVHLIVVGDGPHLRDLQQDLADLPVTFTGYLEGEDLAQAYASSDVFVFPSTFDTMGNVVVEAQASGLPVIVTDRGGPSENMIDRETGLVVHADDRMPNRMAEAVLSLYDRPRRLALMRENARRYTASRSADKRFLDFWNAYP